MIRSYLDVFLYDRLKHMSSDVVDVDDDDVEFVSVSAFFVLINMKLLVC